MDIRYAFKDSKDKSKKSMYLSNLSLHYVSLKNCIDRIEFLEKLLKISPPKYKIDVYVFRNRVHKELIEFVISITCLRFFKFIDKILCNDKQMLTHLITVCFILLVILYFLLSRDFFPSFLLL